VIEGETSSHSSGEQTFRYGKASQQESGTTILNLLALQRAFSFAIARHVSLDVRPNCWKRF